MNKKDALEFAKQFKWTEADAKRAYADLDLKNSVEQDLMLALVKFAGPELLNRQRLQGAQKRLFTMKKSEFEKLETEFAEQVRDLEESIQEQKSFFVMLISKFYAVARLVGMRDPWVEDLIDQYAEYQEYLNTNTNSKSA